MKTKTLYFNGRIYTQANSLVVDSMAVAHGNIVAIGNRLEYDCDFSSYSRIDLEGRTVLPGFTDAHTHFLNYVRTLNQLTLDNVSSLSDCLDKIKQFVKRLPRGSWLVGSGLSFETFTSREIPDCHLLDKLTGDHPAFIYTKDQHSAWVNSKALKLAKIDKNVNDPKGGRIERFPDGSPSGILRETITYDSVLKAIPSHTKKEMDAVYQLALDNAYKMGVTAVHTFDRESSAFIYLSNRAAKGKVGLRINYYAAGELLSFLEKTKTRYGTGTEYFRLAGIKLFSDGALGSQTALCFNRYTGSRSNFGIEVTTIPSMRKQINDAAKLDLPCAIHAIGDKAIANVLEAFESSTKHARRLRHRIEHLQLVRRKDITRIKKLGVVASMQPSHCPSDINMIRKYWGRRESNSFIFRTLQEKNIPLAFGSDCPIEALNPIEGIAAVVRRAKPGSRDVLSPEQRITASSAIFHFTAGATYAAGQEACRGFLLPEYPADFVILDRDINRIAPSRIYGTKVLATVLSGKPCYVDHKLRW